LIWLRVGAAVVGINSRFSESFYFTNGCTMYLFSKVIPQQAEVAEGVSGRLRTRIFLVRIYTGGRSSAICTGRLYPRINPWYSFSEAESTSGHMVPSRGATEKNPQ